VGDPAGAVDELLHEEPPMVHLEALLEAFRLGQLRWGHIERAVD
jgi:hypothetical protein